MLKKRDDYFLVAIAIFIMIAMFVYILSIILGFEYNELNRIVVAISISSYFLSFAEMVECDLDLQQKKYLYAKENFDLHLIKQKDFYRNVEKFIKYANTEYKNNADKITNEQFELLKSLQADTIKAKEMGIKITENEKQIYLKKAKTFSKQSFILKTLAFLCLICVLTFEFLYKLIEQLNPLFCLGAFLFVIVAMGTKAKNLTAFEEYKKETDDYIFRQQERFREMEETMEGYDNGQTQNAGNE